MRCKKHPADLSSTVGVCAACLRERLFVVMAAQAQAQAQLDRRSSHALQQPTPLSFPRSVSPYISLRKSDTNAAASTWQLHQQRCFHSTPLTGSAQLDMRRDKIKGSRGGGGLSSLFLGLFRSKPDKMGLGSDPVAPDESCSVSSPSWYSAIIPGRRKKQNRGFRPDEGAGGARRKLGRDRDRGMSPAISDDEHCYGGGKSGYSSESSQGWRQTPRRTPAAARRDAGHSRNVSGMGFCLSPLVRPSPNRHWNQKGMPPDMIVAGECKGRSKAHLSTAASLCKNRSRKLADFGRYSYSTNH